MPITNNVNFNKNLTGHSSLIFGCILFILFGIRYATIALILLLVGLVVGVTLLEAIKFVMWIGFKEVKSDINRKLEPMVSVHMAIHNEPPMLVIKTIKSVLSQNYENFELLVIDNNTTEETVWMPVKEFCETISEARFFHLKNWPHYKAGALNFARKITNPSARYIFTLDADYLLYEEALRAAISSLDSPNIALVQFPQSYRSGLIEHIPLLEEFKHFFDYYCFKANSCYGALATGTLSLIDVNALDQVGGWPTNSITEDAELSSCLHSAGFNIKYVHEVIGKGIAPIDQFDFYQQRKRWIYGNVQTLLGYAVNPREHFRKWISGVSQLTAWANMLGIPLLCILGCLILAPFYNEPDMETIVLLSYLSLWIFSLSKFGQLCLIHRSQLVLAQQTFLVHFSSLSIGAFHWWPVLFGRKRPFIKTDKLKKNFKYEVNLFYPFLHLGSLLFGFYTSDGFIVLSGTFFLFLHVSSLLFDCWCRNKYFKNISASLKIIS